MFLKFVDPTSNSSAEALRGEVADSEKVLGDNYYFEEQVSPARLSHFEDYCGSMNSSVELKRRHSEYFHEYCCEGDFPATFEILLNPASHVTLDEAQPIVRIENLSRPISASGIEWDELRSAMEAGDFSLVDKFINIWNGIRDIRPLFAAFRDNVLEDADNDDWSHLLRDRFGLAHFQPVTSPIPVAQMVYTVNEVLAEQPDEAVAFTTPTVLDSKPWPYFFPAPNEIPYGRAMTLNLAGDENSLQAEILHTRISYKRNHLKDIGWIDRTWGPVPLKDLRNHHLLCLRMALGREDFGEELG